MSSIKVFLTGATGYIGGEVLYTVTNAHPDWEITTLVRTKKKADLVSSRYPNIHIVQGDLDSVELIEEQVKEADIVFNCANCDHVASAEAIARGARHHTAEHPLWLIHTSGTGILTIEDKRANTMGIERPKEYNDWEGISEMINFPADGIHREVDKIILDMGTQSPKRVHTAIVCPPAISGPGRGPVKTKSSQAYRLSAAVLTRGSGILIGKGENVWHQVHVQDLSNLFLALGDAAAECGGNATWNEEGYYFAEDGSFVWGDIQREIAKQAHLQGLINSPDVHELNAEEVNKISPTGHYAWGSNSRGHALRARKLLGWEPKMPKLIDMIPDIVALEAKDLGLR
ncbi:hypothetical protein N7539_000170 [Penicillium diatomitis]|uniref:NmrA-like domain-containing protein n=1 Tax=Penicillium diatomitis TaxID=2819901 RepID=A0A9X0C2G9_9EURO|nr:uncharacterized protein N7539_000170 [Penicillium diatomitis]KAJ5495054.1 hypothetical protein N7539_000170 [Penicillium diatomitis]